MPYDLSLANNIRTYLATIPKLKIEEKKMFRGLAFMVNGKMCIDVSGDNLMCRFDPILQEVVAGKRQKVRRRKQKNNTFHTPIPPAQWENRPAG